MKSWFFLIPKLQSARCKNKHRNIHFLILIFLIFNFHPGFTQDNQYIFNYLTVDQGLSQNEVTSVLQDSDGFIWIGTRGGLNRYDGKNFISFSSDPSDSNSIVNPSVERIYQTSDKKIWIGTKSAGVSSYDTRYGIFKNYYNSDISDRKSCWGQRVISFCEAGNGQLLIGTWSNGLFVYKKDSCVFTHYLDRQQVGSILQTRDRNIWIGTANGLYVSSPDTMNLHLVPLNTTANHIVCMKEDPDKPVIWIVGWGMGLVSYNYQTSVCRQYFPGPLLFQTQSYSLAVDSSHSVWMGTWSGGLYKFNPNEEKFTRVNIKPENEENQNTDYEVILDIFLDNSGTLWIGTDGGGLCKVIRKMPFNNVTYSSSGHGILNTHVLCVYIDHLNTLWIGTRNGGLYYSDDMKVFHHFSNSVFRNDQLIISLYEGKGGPLWVGQDAGMAVVKREGSKYRYLPADQEFHSPDLKQVNKGLSYLEDSSSFWIGTKERGLFIFKKDKNTYSLKRRYMADPEVKGALKNERISILFKDSDKNIWVGTYGGLHLFSISDSSFIPLSGMLTGDKRLTSDIILFVSEDLNKNLWVGTPNGLNELIYKGYHRYAVESYTQKDGMPNEYVHAILKDTTGNLWISNNAGISRFNPKTREFVNYGVNDGLPGQNFSEAAAFVHNGIFYFGGTKGLTWFDPYKIVENRKIPKLIFTSFSIFNHQVKIGEMVNKRTVLPVSINAIKTLVLTHRDREITFGFAALNYISSDRNNYAYKLEGYNENWQYLGNRNFVSFNNLAPGDYKLHIIGSNNNNVWNKEGISLNIKVLPPPWKTWYAYVIYAVFFSVLIFLIWSATFKRLQLEHSVELEKMRLKQEVEINRIKTDFFTSISHEIRTPLTLIFAPLHELIARFSGKADVKILQKLNIISINAKKLLILVNQLLDFRKVESNEMQIKVAKEDINSAIEDIALPYRELAASESKTFVVDMLNRENELWFDRGMMEIILNNLLSNAFKFSPVHGLIRLVVHDDQNNLFIDVVDNGPGIARDELEKIFNKFYQGKVSIHPGGTGIGLFLVKQLVSLHGGNVEAVSIPGETAFHLTFLKGSDHFKDNQFALSGPEIEQSVLDIDDAPENLITDGELKEGMALEKKILIIEDNKDLRDYLEEMFRNEYIILTADNGIDGYNLITSELPNIVISDITMPKLDGLELCRIVKDNDTLKHIPFLLLTARNAEKYILLGTQYGADDYITKPFNYQVLKNKVKNLVLSRSHLLEKFSKKMILEPSHIEISDFEEVFLKKVVDIIEKNITNPDFNPVILASMLNLSQSSLYRRLHKVTKMTVNGLIRDIRIKHSAQLLADKHKSISEIAYEVGFNDVKYFRNCFQKQFGKTPSEYRHSFFNN